METLYVRCDFSSKLYYVMQKISTTEASSAKSFILLSNSFRGVPSVENCVQMLFQVSFSY